MTTIYTKKRAETQFFYLGRFSKCAQIKSVNCIRFENSEELIQYANIDFSCV